MYINKAIIFGNITRDIELKALPSGNKVANFSIATNRVWKDASGKKNEAADYHNIVFYGKPAEIIAQYMRKGSTILIEGRITTRSWDAQDGSKRYRTEIVGETFQFGPRPQSSVPGGVYRAPESQDAGSAEEIPDVDTIEYPVDDINPNDIPF